MTLPDSLQSALDWLRALWRNRYFWGGLAVLVAIGLGIYVYVNSSVMPSYTRHDVSIRVPNVENRPFEEAEKLIQERDLDVERQEGRYNPNVERGLVVDQNPLPDSEVKPGRRVYLTVNAGEVPRVQIPDLTGMSVREARNRLSSLGLEDGAVIEDPVPSPYANTITKQNPSPGDSIRQGQTVDLWYSTGLGDETVEVPNVVGYPIPEARRTLLGQNLRAVVVDANVAQGENEATGDRVPENDLYVRRQGRSPGDGVRAGTEIRLFTTQDASEATRLREEAGAGDAE